MLFKNFFDTSSAALGASDERCARVWAAHFIDSAIEQDGTVLRDHEGNPVDRALLCAEAERDLAAWEAECREEYAEYEDDMRAEELRQRRAARWFKDEDRGGVA